MKLFLALLVSIFSLPSPANVGPDTLIKHLPKHAALRFNGPFVITSTAALSGTPVQNLIVTARIDLKGDSSEAQWSRMSHAAAIKKLKTLKNFDKLEKVSCFVDFNPKWDQDIEIPKGALFHFTTPENYGSPDRNTQIGKRLRLDTSHDSEISGSFQNKEGRRLFCSFSAVPEFGWGTDFVSDMTLEQLEVLLSPYFDLVY